MATPIRRFTQLQSQHPELTDSSSRRAVLRFRRSESPLSPFSSFTTGEVLPCDYLLRLFGLKDGLHWYKVDQEDREVTAYDFGGLDISFQVDRRMSELFMNMWAQSIGVNVYHVILKDCSNSIGIGIDARMVCDASGFSRRLTSKFGAREKFDADSGWPNTDAYWTYFREKDLSNIDGRLLAGNYPPRSTSASPRAGGGSLGSFLAPQPAPPRTSSPAPASYPRCSPAVRNDFKLPADLSAHGAGEAEQKFNFFRKRYPAIDTLLSDSFELLPGYYDGRTYFVRKGLAYRSPVVAGEGWLAIGNSASFTNPLISPRINVGLGGAWRAANLTAEVFAAPVHEARTVMAAAAESHQEFLHDFMLPRLNNMNRMWYNAFRDHRVFEALPRTLWSVSFHPVDDHYSSEAKVQFTEVDARWGIGAGLDEFQALSAEVLDVLDGIDGGAPPSEEQVQKALAIMKQTVRERTETLPGNCWDRWLRQYDDKLQKVLLMAGDWGSKLARSGKLG
ncbi:hypothetical protein DFH08DRAFT_933540 [Mycena albidolilacea]|uniref:Uncharacterized protein n=1 Tax=Mycena albidolilacea TaxID=1033008 RepID=A0AAD7AEE8_9AGAR|nr:hypothetical protein DFH08DRAFT_933540 [Mycena albidolilacea]